MKYKLDQPDFTVSPLTGMTKRHWIDVCYFLLEGIFSHVRSIDDLPLCPRHEFEISYPNENSSPTRIYAERFEGIARSFLIAGALLGNEPDAVIAGYSMREYYKKHILGIATPGHSSYMLSMKELQDIAVEGETAFQQTCECASLVIGLEQCREVIWNHYTKAEKDLIAAYLSDFGHGRTTAHNWRLFNMLILAFLDKEGYPVDRDLIRDHAQVILSYYAGDGWYRDGHRFDYYTAWAFQVYGPIWNHWYGYQQEPFLAHKIEEYANEFGIVFQSMFDRNGQMTSWARSGIYRNASSSPFAAGFMLNHYQVSPGYARRVNSATLLQFITNEKVFINGVPALGFYGPFTPILQSYNCAESPFWLASAMLSLSYPESHPYWSDQENNGIWEQIDKKQPVTTIMDGPGIVSACLGGNGGVEFRTAKCLFEDGNEYIRYYLRLGFHSHFHWEDFDYQGAEAMQYCICYANQEKPQMPNIMLYGGVRKGVLYRKEYFDFHYNFQGAASIDLADFAVSEGMIRVDKMRIHEKPFKLTLGAYGVPEWEGQPVTIEERNHNGARAVILHNGMKQLAFVSYQGYDSINVKKRTGVNAQAEDSWLIYGECQREKCYGYEPYVLISSVLSRDDGEAWEDQEIFLVKNILFADPQQYGGYGSISLELNDGNMVEVDYEGIEGRLMI